MLLSMATAPPTTAADMVAFYTDAELRVLKGQRVRLGERDLTYADLAQIRSGRQEWEAKARAEANRGRTGYAAADFGGVT